MAALFDAVLSDVSGTLLDDIDVFAPTALAAAAPGRGGGLSVAAHRRVFTFPPALVEAIPATPVHADSWVPYPVALPLRAARRTAGARLGVIPNIGWNIRSSLARAGALELLDDVVRSLEVGFARPDPAIFRRACERLDAEPGRVLHLGDRQVRDGGAARAGLAVYLLAAQRHVQVPRALAAVLRLALLQG